MLSAFDENNVAATEEVKTAKHIKQKAGTKVKFDIKLFYSKEDEKTVNLLTLHRFNEEESFISVGFKPKAKDQKTFIEDLRDFDYIKDLESDEKLSIILESKQVRIGY